MLGPIRKFSTSIYAKILLSIIIIPFVFWGMGSQFKGGNKNVVVVIDKEKYSVESFINFIKKYDNLNQKIDPNKIDQFLGSFISEKIIEKEVEYLEIKLSDISLSQLIKNQKNFKRENKFSRVEYEKFLLENNISAAQFESNFSAYQKKIQVLDFIGGGVYPTKYLVNMTYNKLNQKRDVQIIDLNEIFKKKTSFTEDQIKLYFKENVNRYEQIFKSIKLIELSPKNLIGNEEFTDIFYKKIDEIDYMLIEGKNLEDIKLKFKLKNLKLIKFNKIGEDLDARIINDLSKSLIKSVFSTDITEETFLVESENKYFLIEISNVEKIQKTLDEKSVRNDILLNLEIRNKKKYISELINKINSNTFDKVDFDKLANDENLDIKKISIKNQGDNKELSDDVINHIYSIPEKNVIAVNDISFSQSLLIYIDKVENVTISEDSTEYKKYLKLSKIKTADILYNTYDAYLKKKYEININYQALNIVKNQFN